MIEEIKKGDTVFVRARVGRIYRSNDLNVALFYAIGPDGSTLDSSSFLLMNVALNALIRPDELTTETTKCGRLNDECKKEHINEHT